MTPEQQYLVVQAQQAAQHDDPHPTPVCPASPEGAMPLQSATLSHKKIPIPESGLVAATQRLDPVTPRCEACGNALTPSDGKFCKACSIYGRPQSVTLDAVKLPDWQDLDLRPGNVWQMKPEPKMESYEGIPAEVINEAHILGSDSPHRIIEKLEAQMKGKWAMVRFGQMQSMPVEHAPADAREVEAMRWADSLRHPMLQHYPEDFGYVMTWTIGHYAQRHIRVEDDVLQRAVDKARTLDKDEPKLVHAVAVEMYLRHGPAYLEGTPPEEMVNVRGEQRNVDEYCVATPVRLDDRSKNAQRMLEVMHDCDKMAQEATGMPCTIPSVEEALAMRELVEKVAAALHGKNEAAREVSFLNVTREYGGHIAAWTDDAVAAEREEIGRRSKGE